MKQVGCHPELCRRINAKALTRILREPQHDTLFKEFTHQHQSNNRNLAPR